MSVLVQKKLWFTIRDKIIGYICDPIIDLIGDDVRIFYKITAIDTTHLFQQL